VVSFFRPHSEPCALWRHIAITGASSGIGAALARALARPGIMLSLGGRDLRRLAQTVEACRSQGADACGAAIDVVQREALRDWLAGRAQAGPIDLLIASAGVTDEFGRPPQEVATVNFVGIINTIEVALPLMTGGGQLALLSSLAAWRAQPSAPAYAASKAAVRLYAEAIRGRLEAAGLSLSVVFPGCIATPMLDRRADTGQRMLSAERAAAIIIAGLIRRRATIAFPKAMYAKARLMALLAPAATVAESTPTAGRGPATARWRPG
jgi:short-subunit dehydrogenase